MKFVIYAYACALLAWSKAASADTYYCGTKNGVPWYAIGAPPRGVKCVRLVERPWRNPQAKGAKCVAQRFRFSVFYRCEKDGIVWLFNQNMAPEKGRTSASAEPESRTLTTDPKRVRLDSGTVERVVAKASAETGIPKALLMAVIYVESRFRPQAVSPAGAQGLMQLMPATADFLEVEDPLDPEQNVLGGAKLLRRLADRFDGDIAKALAAYYAGPAAVTRSGGFPDESCARYVELVLTHYRRYAREMDRGQVEE